MARARGIARGIAMTRNIAMTNAMIIARVLAITTVCCCSSSSSSSSSSRGRKMGVEEWRLGKYERQQLRQELRNKCKAKVQREQGGQII